MFNRSVRLNFPTIMFSFLQSHVLVTIVLVFCVSFVISTGTGDFRNAGLHRHGAKGVGLKGFGTEDENDPENQLKNENFVRNAELVLLRLHYSFFYTP